MSGLHSLRFVVMQMDGTMRDNPSNSTHYGKRGPGIVARVEGGRAERL